MAYSLRTPTLCLALLSLSLSIAIIGTAGRSLHVFSANGENPWFIPSWRNHFDLRELQTLIGTSAAIVVLNAAVVVALFVSVLPANGIILVASFLSTLVAIVAIALPATLNDRAPTTDTLKTWTCRWSNTYITVGNPAPIAFQSLCQNTRFAFYTTIPILLTQLLLLGLSIGTLVRASPRRAGHEDLEKDGHPLRSVQSSHSHATTMRNGGGGSFDKKSERSYLEGGSGRGYGGKA